MNRKGVNNMIDTNKIKLGTRTVRNYSCPFCGRNYVTPQGVVECVEKCAKKAVQQEEENIKAMNEAIEEIKRITQVRQGMLDDFKKKYPEAYEKNFGSSEDKVNWNNTRTYVNKDIKEIINKDRAKEFIDFLNFLAGR